MTTKTTGTPVLDADLAHGHVFIRRAGYQELVCAGCGKTRRAYRRDREVTGVIIDCPQRPYGMGRCIHCRQVIVGRTEPAWHRAVQSPCPNCGRPW